MQPKMILIPWGILGNINYFGVVSFLGFIFFKREENRHFVSVSLANFVVHYYYTLSYFLYLSSSATHPTGFFEDGLS